MRNKTCLPSRERLRNTSLLFLLFLAMPGRVQAQNRPFPYALGVRDLVMVPVGLGMSFWGQSLVDGYDLIARDEISRLTPSDVNWFDRSATRNWSLEWDDRSDGYRDMVVRAALLLLGAETTYSLLGERFTEPLTLATMFAETYLFTAGITYTTKGLTGRKRPYVYNAALSVDERYAIATSDGNEVFFSFYSGHAAAAFAAATFTSKVFADIHGTSAWSYLVWGSTLSVATVTAYARVKAGVHYPSDAIVGALAGSAIGYLVPALHKRSSGDRLSLLVTPAHWGLQLRF